MHKLYVARGRDYAGQHRGSQAPAKGKPGGGKGGKKGSSKQGALPAWAWMVLGISVLLLVLVIYTITRPTGPMQMSPTSEVTHAEPKKGATGPKVVIPPREKPKYDFYTMLPNEQVEASRPNNANAEARPPPPPGSVPKPEVATSTPPPAPVAHAQPEPRPEPAPVGEKPVEKPKPATPAPVKPVEKETPKPAEKEKPKPVEKAAPKPVEKPKPQTPPAATETAKAPESSKATGRYLLQTAAYRNRADADKERAGLALAGLAAHIEQGQVADVTWYRVRLGPFASRDAALAAQAKLKASGHQAVLIPAGR